MAATNDGAWPEPPGDTRAEQLAWIVEHRQAGTVDGLLVDMQTANMLLIVRGALKAPGLARWDTLPITRLVDVGWKVVTPK